MLLWELSYIRQCYFFGLFNFLVVYYTWLSTGVGADTEPREAIFFLESAQKILLRVDENIFCNDGLNQIAQQ